MARALDLPPDQPVVFSGAQLHGSGLAQSATSRFSLEFRVLSLEDLLAGAGAPNVDGAAPHIMLRWFHRLSDGAPLETLVEINRIGRKFALAASMRS